MKFLLRAAFWLALIALLLPAHSSQNASTSPLNAGEAASAASAAVSDLSRFCERQHDACVVGSEALTGFAQTAQAGARTLYDLLIQRFRGQPGAVEKSGHAAGSPGQNTLSPADLTAPWHRSPAPKQAEAKRAA